MKTVSTGTDQKRWTSRSIGRSAFILAHRARPRDTVGIEELRAASERFHEAFPDLHIALDDVIAAGDRVAARWTATGTHRGELAGISATGRQVRWGGIDVYRFADGKIVEWWRNDDFAWLLQQLGRDPLTPPG